MHKGRKKKQAKHRTYVCKCQWQNTKWTVRLPPVQNYDVIVVSNYDVGHLMKLVWEIQTYPVINFPKYVACHLHDKKKLEDPYYLLNLSLDHRQSQPEYCTNLNWSNHGPTSKLGFIQIRHLYQKRKGKEEFRVSKKMYFCFENI